MPLSFRPKGLPNSSYPGDAIASAASSSHRKLAVASAAAAVAAWFHMTFGAPAEDTQSAALSGAAWAKIWRQFLFWNHGQERGTGKHTTRFEMCMVCYLSVFIMQYVYACIYACTYRYRMYLYNLTNYNIYIYICVCVWCVCALCMCQEKHSCTLKSRTVNRPYRSCLDSSNCSTDNATTRPSRTSSAGTDSSECLEQELALAVTTKHWSNNKMTEMIQIQNGLSSASSSPKKYKNVCKSTLTYFGSLWCYHVSLCVVGGSDLSLCAGWSLLVQPWHWILSTSFRHSATQGSLTPLRFVRCIAISALPQLWPHGTWPSHPIAIAIA